jgi:hypothetical protein
MRWRRIVRAGAWLLLFGITLVQLLVALGDEPYVPLKEDQYRIQYANADEPGGERMKDVRVFVRYDLWTPIPLLETSSVSLVALLALIATGTPVQESRTPSAG